MCSTMRGDGFLAAGLCAITCAVLLNFASGEPSNETTPKFVFLAPPGAPSSVPPYDVVGTEQAAVGESFNGTDSIMFEPPRRIDVGEEHEVVIQVFFARRANRTVEVVSGDTGVATVDVSNVYLDALTNGTGFNVTVRGVFVSYTKIFFKTCLVESGLETDCTGHSYLVAVLRVPTPIQQSFPFLIAIIVAINYISMGCQIELGVIINSLKKPLPPLLGCACQFLFMPLVSYGMGLLLMENALMRFGIFLLGCSPGGNSSNLWTLIFNGDVTLSVTMTFISTIASIGMMPLWVFLLGRHMSPETGALSIPFGNIVSSLVGLAVPLAVGMLIKRFKPKWALKLSKYIKPVTLIVIVTILVLSVTVNRYIFLLMTWQALLCGALVSWSAYIFGALAAFVGRLSREQIIAVAIEIAFQNSGIAVVILYTSLPLPDADLVIVPVVCQTILQGVPLYVIYIARRILKCFSKEPQLDEKPVPVPGSEQEAENGLFQSKPASVPTKDAVELDDVLAESAGDDLKSRL